MDAVLRVYAQTRFLLVMNLVRFVVVAGLIGWFLDAFGLARRGAGDAAVAMAVVKGLGVVRIAQLLQVRPARGAAVGAPRRITLLAGVAAVPVALAAAPA